MSAWTIELPLSEGYVDYLGHVTAAAHLTLFEEAHAQWLAEIIHDPRPPFVLVRLELDYRRELLLSDGPVTVTLEPVSISRSTVSVFEVLASGGGPHTEARAILVRWDREWRRSTPFPARERQRIKAQLAG